MRNGNRQRNVLSKQTTGRLAENSERWRCEFIWLVLSVSNGVGQTPGAGAGAGAKSNMGGLTQESGNWDRPGARSDALDAHRQKTMLMTWYQEIATLCRQLSQPHSHMCTPVPNRAKRRADSAGKTALDETAVPIAQSATAVVPSKATQLCSSGDQRTRPTTMVPDGVTWGD